MVIFALHKSSGFTLVETLVAISILLIVVVSPLTIAQKGIRNAFFANEQVTAVFLAQEAIESVRQLRDADGLDAYDALLVTGSADTWNAMNALEDLCDGEDCAYVRDEAFPFVPCDDSDANACVVTISATDGSYGHTGVEDTHYTRTVRITNAVYNGSEIYGIEATVDVAWETSLFGEKHVVLQTWIYDQYKRYE